MHRDKNSDQKVTFSLELAFFLTTYTQSDPLRKDKGRFHYGRTQNVIQNDTHEES